MISWSPECGHCPALAAKSLGDLVSFTLVSFFSPHSANFFFIPLGPGKLPPHLGRRGSSPPFSPPSSLVSAHPQPYRGFCGSRSKASIWALLTGGLVPQPSALSTSAGAHNWVATLENDKEEIKRWQLQVVLQKKQPMLAIA